MMLAWLKRLLCKIDLHRWQDVHQCEWTGWTQEVDQKCAWCGKAERVVFISPISGHRRPVSTHIDR